MQAADADLALAAPPAVLTDAGATAFLAEVALPPMLTDAGTAALPADLAMLSVLADAGAATGFAGAAPPPVLAKVTAAAFLAVAAPPPVLADAAAAALPALCAPPAMRTRRGHDDRPNPASDWGRPCVQLHLVWPPWIVREGAGGVQLRTGLIRGRRCAGCAEAAFMDSHGAEFGLSY